MIEHTLWMPSRDVTHIKVKQDISNEHGPRSLGGMDVGQGYERSSPASIPNSEEDKTKALELDWEVRLLHTQGFEMYQEIGVKPC